MRVLVTGGTGSLGTALARRLVPAVERFVVYSRDEQKQAALAAELGQWPSLRCFLGDVRDATRLRQALHDIDVVIHAAALKRVDAVAYSPGEAIKTNVLGSVNVIDAAIARRVPRVLVISSDKAVMPTNYYGQTKALMEGYAVAANAQSVPQGTRIGVVRYGNVLGSRGSVVLAWRQQLAAGQPLTVTDETMSRFWLTLDDAVAFILTCLDRLQGGEIAIPKLRAMVLTDLADALAPGAPREYHRVLVGLRPGGEKHHETLLTPEEVTRTLDQGDRYVVVPAHREWSSVPYDGVPVPADFVYTSETAPRLGTDEMRAMLKEAAE